MGVLILRALLIGLGAALVTSFHWVLYGFGAILVVTGIGMLVRRDGSDEIVRTLLRWLQQRLPVTGRFHGKRFFIRTAAPRRLWATPLLLALVLIELLDLLFAVDSVPAVFAITQDPFIVYTSNVFAVLGLRALYFSLADLTERFHYLRYALAAVLVFVGGKILAADVIGTMPAWVSLSGTVGLLAAGVLYSLHRTRAAPAYHSRTLPSGPRQTGSSASGRSPRGFPHPRFVDLDTEPVLSSAATMPCPAAGDTSGFLI